MRRFLEYTNFKDDLIQYKSYWGTFDKKLNERLFNSYKFCNYDNNELILLLWKGVYPYEYMDD